LLTGKFITNLKITDLRLLITQTVIFPTIIIRVFSCFVTTKKLVLLSDKALITVSNKPTNIVIKVFNFKTNNNNKEEIVFFLIST